MTDFDTLVAFLALLAAVAVVLAWLGVLTASLRKPAPPTTKQVAAARRLLEERGWKVTGPAPKGGEPS